MRGPITVHEYMSLCINHPELGYYHQNNEKIGQEGDFITSPEISQIFGEMLAIWCISMWEKMGCPPKINLIEMGPGHATLMKDLLRTFKKFPKFKESVQVNMIELSEDMKKVQQIALIGQVVPSSSSADSNRTPSFATSVDGVKIAWYRLLREVPQGDPILFLGQEILDTFPVHQFQYTGMLLLSLLSLRFHKL